MSEVVSGSRIKVRLVVTSDAVEPEKFSELLDVHATKTWKKGDRVHPKAQNTHKENGWVLSVQSRPGELLAQALVDRLIAMIPIGRLTKLHSEFRDAASIELSIVVNLEQESSTPSVALSAPQIKLLADCGATVDVDIYM